MKKCIIPTLVMLVLQVIPASFSFHRELLVLDDAQAADLLGATIADREAPSLAMRIGVVGIHPTVSAIRYGSQAEHCGLSKGDIILKIGNIPVNQTTDILSRLADSSTFTVLRNLERFTVACDATAPSGRAGTPSQGPDKPIVRSADSRPEAARQVTSKSVERVNKLTLQNYLLNGKFDLLEKELNKLQRGTRKGDNDDRIVEQALSSFRSTDPRFEMLINNWIKEYPSSAIAMAARGYYYSKLGWTSRGTDWADKTQAEKLRSMENYFKKSGRDLTEACRLDPGLSVAFGELILLSKAVGNSRVSGELLTAGLLQSPGSYVVRASYLSSLQPKWGGSMEGIQLFLTTIKGQIGSYPKLSPLLGYYDYVRADTLLLDKNYQDAIVYYTKAIRGGLPVWKERGRAYDWLGRESETLSDFENALAHDPQDVGSLEARGIVYNKKKEYNLAIQDFNAALQLDPLNPSVLVNRSYTLQVLNRNKEAIADLRASLEYDGFNPYVYQQIGSVEGKFFKNFKEAKKNFKKAVELKPDEPAYLYNYLEAIYHLKECEVEIPYTAYNKACSSSGSDYCSEKRKEWADRFYRYAKNSREYGCRAAGNHE
jgi:tetratricopeptide (TPR) repeat protein